MILATEIKKQNKTFCFIIKGKILVWYIYPLGGGGSDDDPLLRCIEDIDPLLERAHEHGQRACAEILG